MKNKKNPSCTNPSWLSTTLMKTPSNSSNNLSRLYSDSLNTNPITLKVKLFLKTNSTFPSKILTITRAWLPLFVWTDLISLISYPLSKWRSPSTIWKSRTSPIRKISFYPISIKTIHYYTKTHQISHPINQFKMIQRLAWETISVIKNPKPQL